MGQRPGWAPVRCGGEAQSGHGGGGEIVARHHREDGDAAWIRGSTLGPGCTRPWRVRGSSGGSPAEHGIVGPKAHHSSFDDDQLM